MLKGKMRGRKSDIHEDKNSSISHELLHVLVRLPLPDCFVHLN